MGEIRRKIVSLTVRKSVFIDFLLRPHHILLLKLFFLFYAFTRMVASMGVLRDRYAILGLNLLQVIWKLMLGIEKCNL